jgi:hypothetical protein
MPDVGTHLRRRVRLHHRSPRTCFQRRSGWCSYTFEFLGSTPRKGHRTAWCKRCPKEGGGPCKCCLQTACQLIHFCVGRFSLRCPSMQISQCKHDQFSRAHRCKGFGPSHHTFGTCLQLDQDHPHTGLPQALHDSGLSSCGCIGVAANSIICAPINACTFSAEHSFQRA